MKTNSRILQNVIFASAISLGMVGCTDDVRTDGFTNSDLPEIHELSQAQKDVIAYTPKNAIIAHRGTEFWAPEESEAAMR